MCVVGVAASGTAVACNRPAIRKGDAGRRKKEAVPVRSQRVLRPRMSPTTHPATGLTVGSGMLLSPV